MKVAHIILILFIFLAKYALSSYETNLIIDNEIITEIIKDEVKRKKGIAGRTYHKMSRKMEEIQNEQLKEIKLLYDEIQKIEKDTLAYHKLLLYANENIGGQLLLAEFKIKEKKYDELPEILKFYALEVDIFKYLNAKYSNSYVKEKNMKILVRRIIEIGEDSILLAICPIYCLPIEEEMNFHYEDKKIEVKDNPFFFKGDIKDLKIK